jgi:heat shock protein HslJ
MRSILHTLALGAALLALQACSSATADAGSGGTNGHSSEPQVRGVAWHLVELNGGPVLPGVSGEVPSLLLDAAELRASGYTGVNRFSGAVKMDRKQLVFGALSTTKMAGPPELMKQETAYLGALGACATYSVASIALELADAKGVVVARFGVAKPGN